MKFVDQVKVELRSGKGGAGASHFRREKFVPLGGPDGGNGGNGGSVIFIADQNKHSLLDFQFKPLWHAKDGKPGQGNNKDGESGEDLYIPVPPGTQVLDVDSGECLADLEQVGQEFVIAKGGRGGKGNSFFKTSTNQAPTHSQPGEPGIEKTCLLNLKLIADVGLVGFPNAGKSTFISCVSAAKPKIADYPFTTLTPNLGIVSGRNRTFVVADIPGLIPGAHQGKGLGIQFLKHIERTRVLLFLIDPLAYDDAGELLSPRKNYEHLRAELENHNSDLAKMKSVVVINKIDTFIDSQREKEIREEFQDLNVDLHFISCVSKQGLQKLVYLLEEML